MYEVEIKKTAQKDLDKLDERTFGRIDVIIQNLKENPFPIKAKKLTGRENEWRIRTGNYRILYHTDKKRKVITIFRVKHRREVYY